MPGRLQPDTVARVNARCAALERAAGAELAIVVSLDGDAIENVAVSGPLLSREAPCVGVT